MTGAGLTVEDLLAKMDFSLRDMALEDVKRACKPGNPKDGAKMGGFLLGFCFIDAAAGFRAGRTKEMRGVIGPHFREFVGAYMPRYDAAALYDDLRNGLVHSYTVGETYSFTDREQAGKHLETKTFSFGRRTLLNLEDFVSDLEKAYEALREDVRTNPDRFAKAKRRYESNSLLSVGS